MAQLVKLLDYVSRYENDLSRYPTQYIRLKNSQWKRMKTQWEHGADLSEWRHVPEEEEQAEEGKWYSPLFRLFGNRKGRLEEVKPIEAEKDRQEDVEVLDFNPNIIYHPKNVEQLRKLYLDQLFHFQLKWASSTMLERSNLDPGFMRDSLLRGFTQRLPDSYLLFYYPILKVKKAPVELDILLITPIECLCITVLEKEDAAAFIGEGDRFWTKKYGDEESKVLNPLIGLNRMEKIVSGIFSAQDIDFPIKKLIISRNGYIDYPGVPFDTTVIDRRMYEEWFASLQKSTVPMKFNQFKAAQSILDIGQTTAVSRLFEEQNEQGQPDTTE
ncbi:nuclease-related domain-containing protein [Sporosarcina luteola]|uniref:nuclease-related domain-containing protein n=1 Tax=Sporosarcina luteola TaxID=582850 RepID=UPI00203BA95B|nr:nuclease-related domain-containing protein [Sporosarcina luteola]MCM3712120.1 NERD domain-containing protein [Sporosarcina luteola]